jgi:hypothetical protein
MPRVAGLDDPVLPVNIAPINEELAAPTNGAGAPENVPTPAA